MTKGLLVLYLLVLLTIAGGCLAAHRTRRYGLFALIALGLALLFAVLSGVFVSDCLIPKPDADGFLLTPVIRFALQDDRYSYEEHFLPGLARLAGFATAYAVTGLWLLLRRRRWKRLYA